MISEAQLSALSTRRTSHYTRVHLEGTILDHVRFSHKYDDVNYYSVTIIINRSHKTEVLDKVNIFLDETKVNKLELSIGLPVRVIGNLVQSYNESVKTISVLVRSIEEIKDESTPISGYNKSTLRGTIYKMYEIRELGEKDKCVKSFLIKCSPLLSDRSVTIKVAAWNQMGRYIEESYSEGDTIEIEYKLESRYIYQKDTGKTVMRTEAVILSIYN